ncbi:MAG TPA: hypothetical protein VMY37_12165 [Thermoguttaceae bacterium]|nr:hypothetical protein [Thermoguttaceae bacterium]
MATSVRPDVTRRGVRKIQANRAETAAALPTRRRNLLPRVVLRVDHNTPEVNQTLPRRL